MQHNQSGPSQQHKTHSIETQGKTEPGLVTFYDIQPGNSSGLFFQRWNPTGPGTHTGSGVL